MTLRSGSRMKTDTCPSWPKVTGHWAMQYRSLSDQRSSPGSRRREAQYAIARKFVRHLHQDVGSQIAGIGIEHEIELDAALIANDADVVVLGPADQVKSKHSVEAQ